MAFPHLTVMYHQDFEDYAKMEVPFMFERLVVGDRKAAQKVLGEGSNEPVFASAFELGGVDDQVKGDWWEPVRRNVELFLDLDQESLGQKVVTYVMTQDMEGKVRMKQEQHEKLVSALKRMERNIGCEVQVIYEDTGRTPWTERMEAIVRSTVRFSFPPPLAHLADMSLLWK